MQVMDTLDQVRPASLPAAVRNRYYFGKMLDVVHFDIEQDYFNNKRWLINRMVLGYGVVCGLDVQLTNNNKSILVTSGFAIDKWGREIIVPSDSRAIDLPTPPAPKPQPAPAPNAPAPATPTTNGCDDEDCYNLCICYYECASSPEPGLGDDCGQSSCVSSLIQERYKLEWVKGAITVPPPDDCIAKILSGDQINRRDLASYVTHSCGDIACNPCLPLANVKLAKPESGNPADVDISVRPIVYTNDLLFNLITAWGANQRPRVGK